MASLMKEVSVVIPVYNSESTLREVVDRLAAVFQGKRTLEVILVNDGSRDGSHRICKELAQAKDWIKFVSFYRNFGQINAVLAGLREANGKYVVTIDDDLQNPPEEIPKLLATLDEGFDFAFGVPEKYQGSIFRKLGSRAVAKLSEWMFNKPRHLNHSSFMAIRGGVVSEMVKYEGPYPYISGLIFRVTHHGANVVVRHEARKVGVSQYSFSKLIRLWVNGMTNFSILPLRIASYTGLAVALAGFAVLCAMLVEKLLYGRFLQGWASVMGSILLFAGTQLLALGVLGEYIGRIFMLLNRTPQYSVKEKYGCE